MDKQHQFHWQIWGTIAIFLGILGITESPAIAFPDRAEDSYELAQVGVGSRINAPTPLNLRPRTHIPLPPSRYNHYEYPQYRDVYRSPRYRYDRDRYRDRHYTHRRDRTGVTVIIINPSYNNSYSNYDSYIRIIKE